MNAPAWSPGLDCDTPTALHAWSHPHSTLGLPAPRHVLICALCPRETSPKLCYCSVTRSCPTLCSPMDCSMPGFPVLHHPPEFAQTHVHGVGDAIQPSHRLSLTSPSLNLSQHQESFPMSQFFTSGGQSTGVSVSARALPASMSPKPTSLQDPFWILRKPVLDFLVTHGTRSYVSVVVFALQVTTTHAPAPPVLVRGSLGTTRRFCLSSSESGKDRGQVEVR